LDEVTALGSRPVTAIVRDHGFMRNGMPGPEVFEKMIKQFRPSVKNLAEWAIAL
jgi:hypothetical protein